MIIDEKINKQNENLVKEIDKNLNKYLIEKPDISKYKDQYTFKNNNDILNSFIKILMIMIYHINLDQKQQKFLLNIY